MINEFQSSSEKFPTSISIDQILQTYEQTFFNDMYAPNMKIHTKNSYLERLNELYNSGTLTSELKLKIVDLLKRVAKNEKELLEVRKNAVKQIRNLNSEEVEDILEELYLWRSPSDTPDKISNSDNMLLRNEAEISLTDWIANEKKR